MNEQGPRIRPADPTEQQSPPIETDRDIRRPDEPEAKPDDDRSSLLREGTRAPDAADIEDPDTQL
jgi:hypothetical protein